MVNTFRMPKYQTLDASMAYQRRKYRFALNVKNLADEKYFEGANNRFTIRPGTPRVFLFSVATGF